jgi:hypothetical protein
LLLANDPMDHTQTTEIVHQSGDSVLGSFGQRMYPTSAARYSGAARLDGLHGSVSRMAPSSQMTGTTVRYRFDEGSIVRETWPVWADTSGLWTNNQQFIARAS